MRGVDRRSIFAGLGASALVLATVRTARAGAIVEYRTSSRLMPLDDQTYQPPTSLQTVADIYRRMTAQVGVAGGGPYPFVVDTGANQSVISQELADALKLPIGPQAPLNGVAGVQLAPTTRADLTIGGRRLEDASLAVLPRKAMGGEGMLGLDALDGDELTLDFKARSLRIDRGRRPWRDVRDVAVKAERRDGQLTLVDADLAGIPVVAFIDSGAQNTIGNMALRALAITRHPTTAWSSTPIVSATGQTIPCQMAELPDLQVGGMTMADWPVAFADLHTFRMWNLVEKPAILVGVDVLSRFERVCLDFARNEVRFRPPESIW